MREELNYKSKDCSPSILWLSHLVPYPPKSGVAQRSYNLLKQVAKYHHVHLLAFNQPRLFDSSIVGTSITLESAIRKLEEYCTSVEVFSIPSESNSWKRYATALFSLLSLRSYNWLWLASTDYSRAVSTAIKKLDAPFVVHIDTISLARHIPNPSKLLTVLNHHNIESEMMRRRSVLSSSSLRKFAFLAEAKKLVVEETRVGKAARTNLVCSDLDGDRLRHNVSGVAVETVPNGADLSLFDFAKTHAISQRVLFIGTLDWYPNRQAVREIAQKILPVVVQSKSDVVFDIVGGNPPNDLVEDAKTNKQLNVPGFVPDIDQYWRSGAIFLCPIRDGGGTKLKMIEAMAAGLAIVAHPIAAEGLRLVHGENVLLGETSEELANQVLDLLKDSDLRSRLGANAKHTASVFYDYEALGRKLSGLYNDIANCSQR